MKEIIVSEKYNIKLGIVEVGDDLCVIISGGDAPHIGAVSCGVYGPGVGAAHPDKVDLSKIEAEHTYVYPAHKDGAISRPLAEELSKKLKKNVVVVCGIHVDGLSKEGIAEITDMLGDMEKVILEECPVKPDIISDGDS